MVLKKKAKKGSGLTLKKPAEKQRDSAQNGEDQQHRKKTLPAKRKALSVVADDPMPKKSRKKGAPREDVTEGDGDDAKKALDVPKKKGAAALRQNKRKEKKHARFAFAEPLDTSKPKQSDPVPETGGTAEKLVAPVVRRTPGHPLRVFVGGLPKVSGLDPLAVRAHFEKCGAINGVSLPLNSRQIPMGIAFIEFAHRKAVAKALGCNGKEFQGSQISVKMDRGSVQKQKMASTSDRKDQLKPSPQGDGSTKSGRRQKKGRRTNKAKQPEAKLAPR